MRKPLSVCLVLALAVVGIPVSAFAGPRPLTRAQQAQTGTVTGTAKDARGRKIAGATIRVRNSATGAIAAETVTDAAGGFTVAGLLPASYIVEVISNGVVIGLSPVVAIAAGATASVGVTATAVGAIGAAGAASGGVGLFGLGTAATVGIIGAAATAGVVGVKKAKKDKKDASPSR